MITSPYAGYSKDQWSEVTEALVKEHPLSEYLVDIVFKAWSGLFTTSIGNAGLKIGRDVFPRPQVIGSFLHELIPAEIELAFPGEWRKESDKADKDIVCVNNNFYSIELKTSSNKNKIFGNRSYAQKPSVSGKNKDGYYLAVNFEGVKEATVNPEIKVVRFGWLDHSDWIAQAASTGQQARLATETYQLKFVTLYGDG